MDSLKKLNLYPYYHPFRDPRHRLEINTTNQTIPSRRRPSDEFVRLIRSGVDAMSEIVVAFAKVPPPSFSVTLAAGTPFGAYLLVSRLVGICHAVCIHRGRLLGRLRLRSVLVPREGWGTCVAKDESWQLETEPLEGAV